MNQIRLQYYKLMAANKTISESERANYLSKIKEMEDADDNLVQADKLAACGIQEK